MQTHIFTTDKSEAKLRATTTDKRANDLDGKTWLQYSISVWNDIRKTADEKKLSHPAMFPVELPKRIIQMFLTNNGDAILDPFLGSGSTLVAARQLGKKGYGFEISKEYADIATKRINNTDTLFDNGNSHKTSQKVFIEDARNIHNHIEKNSISLCITSPPYWDILQQKRSVDLKETRDYEEAKDNMGNIKSYGDFLMELSKVFNQVYKVLEYDAYCVVVVMDIRKKDKFYPFHADIASFMQDIGFIFDDIIIWDRRHEYNNLKPLGYPFVFRINKIHEFILIFRKPPKAKNGG